MIEPTPLQRRYCRFIYRYQREHGYPPALRDICDAFEVRSTNAARCNIALLQKKGLITRGTNAQSRTLLLTDLGVRLALGHESAVPVRRELKCEVCGATTFAAGKPCPMCRASKQRAVA